MCAKEIAAGSARAGEVMMKAGEMLRRRYALRQRQHAMSLDTLPRCFRRFMPRRHVAPPRRRALRAMLRHSVLFAAT